MEGPNFVSRYVPSRDMFDKNDIAAKRRRYRDLFETELAITLFRAKKERLSDKQNKKLFFPFQSEQCWNETTAKRLQI